MPFVYNNPVLLLLPVVAGEEGACEHGPSIGKRLPRQSPRVSSRANHSTPLESIEGESIIYLFGLVRWNSCQLWK